MTELFYGRRVRVYRNLHTGTFSVQDAKTGRVIAHPTAICLENVKFVVRPAGRERVLRERKKFVHAFAVGFITAKEMPVTAEVGYNPYLAGHFRVRTTERRIDSAAYVKLEDNKIFI